MSATRLCRFTAACVVAWADSTPSLTSSWTVCVPTGNVREGVGPEALPGLAVAQVQE